MFVRNSDDLVQQWWCERGKARQKSYGEQAETDCSSLINAMCSGRAAHNLSSLCVGGWRFPHLAGQFKEKLPEVTSTTEVREHCTYFCWQGFQHAFVATLSNLCWPNPINMILYRLLVFVQMSLLSSVPKHLFRRETGISISVAHVFFWVD